jgi:hypothetical protein
MDEDTFWVHSDVDITVSGSDEVCSICDVVQPWWREAGRSKHLTECTSVDAESENTYESNFTQFIRNENPPSESPLIVQHLPKWLTYIEHALTGNIRRDEIHLGDIFCGSITMPGQFKKNIFLQFRQRISPKEFVLVEFENGEDNKKVYGTNLLEPVWQDINLQYKNFVRRQLLDLYSTLQITPDYESLLISRIRNIYQSSESKERFDSLLSYRMQFYSQGFYVVEKSGYVSRFDPVTDNPFKEIEDKAQNYGEQIFFVYELPKRLTHVVMKIR